MSGNDSFEYSDINSDHETHAEHSNSNNNEDSELFSHRPETPTGGLHGVTDSNPSLAISTPSSDRFQLEFEREKQDQDNFTSSQSQIGMKSGMYVGSSTKDFAEKLMGDVVVERQWATLGTVREKGKGRVPSNHANPAHSGPSKMEWDSVAQSIATDITFDTQPSFNRADDPSQTGSQMSPVLNNSDFHNTNEASAISEPMPASLANNAKLSDTLKGIPRAHSRSDEFPDEPFEDGGAGLRSALRGNNLNTWQSDSDEDRLDIRSRRVSFFGVPSSAESSLIDDMAHKDFSDKYSDKSTGPPLLRNADDLISLTRPPWSDSPNNSNPSLYDGNSSRATAALGKEKHHVLPANDGTNSVEYTPLKKSTSRNSLHRAHSLQSGVEASSYSIDLGRSSTDGRSGSNNSANGPPNANGNSHRRYGSLDTSISQEANEDKGSATGSSSSRPISILGGIAGVGMGLGGSVFRKFADWSQRVVSPQNIPHKYGNSSSLSKQSDASPKLLLEDKPYYQNNAYDLSSKYNMPGTSHNSSISTSTTSPLRVEPMRQHSSTSGITPQSSKVIPGSVGSAYNSASYSVTTTPRNNPMGTLRRGSVTPGSDVNPLTRHLAIKAMKSASPAHRRFIDSIKRNDSSFSASGASFYDRSFATPQSNTTDPLDISEIQKQVDGFASLLRHDASAVIDDVRENEEVWSKLQNELSQAQEQLFKLQDSNGYYERQLAEMEHERGEWEIERRQLLNDKRELSKSVDEWRRRIGDIDLEHEGILDNRAQSREGLLAIIARLEDSLDQARNAEASAQKQLRTTTSQYNHDIAKWSSERENLIHHIDDLEWQYGALSDDNANMKSDIEKWKTMAYNVERDSQDQNTFSADLKFKLIDTEARMSDLEKRLFDSSSLKARAEARLVEAEARAHSFEVKIDDLVQQVESFKAEKSKMLIDIGSLEDDKQKITETMSDLLEENKRLKAERIANTKENSTASSSEKTTDESESAESNNPKHDGNPKHEDNQKYEDNPKDLENENTKLQDELKRMTNDYDIIIEQMKNLMKERSKIKAEYKEVMDISVTARKVTQDTEAKLNEAISRENELKRQLAAVKGSKTEPRNVEIEIVQLTESNEQLKAELDRAEAANESSKMRIQSLDKRNKSLSERNDELLQRIARMETELSDLQLAYDNSLRKEGEQIDINELRQQLETQSKVVAELEEELSNLYDENDRVRQKLSKKETSSDEIEAELVRARDELKSEKTDSEETINTISRLRKREEDLQTEIVMLKDKLAKMTSKRAGSDHESGTKQSRTESGMVGISILDESIADQPERLVRREFELSQSVRGMKSNISMLEHSKLENSKRIEKLKKEENFLVEQMRDALIRNASLRSGLATVILRRAGRLRELNALKHSQSKQSDHSSASDDGNISMTGTINNIPTSSQILDGTSAKFFTSLDQYLEEMDQIIDNAPTSPSMRSQRSLPVQTTPLHRSNSQPTSHTTRTRILTPIKEEGIVVQSYLQVDVGVQCNLYDESVMLETRQQVSDEIENLRSQEYRLTQECKQLRTKVAEVEQERDQYMISHEEAAERVLHLSGQIEELSEYHERMRADNMTTARISRRVNRQLRVLNRVLERLSKNKSENTSGATLGSSNSETGNDKKLLEGMNTDDTLAMEEDDAMNNATLDLPLGAYGHLSVDDLKNHSDIEMSEGNGKGSLHDQGEVDSGLGSNEIVMEQIGTFISDAYNKVQLIRSWITHKKNERSRLLSRLAKSERRKLPSFELAEKWGRQLRQRSYTESLVGSGGVGSSDGPMSMSVDVDDDDTTDADNVSDGNYSILDNTDPPESLFLLEDSPELLSNYKMNDTDVSKTDSKRLVRSSESAESPKSNQPTTPGTITASLSDTMATIAQISRLTSKLKRREKRLKVVEMERNKLDEFNKDLIQKLDRAYSEKLHALQECHAMSLRTNFRSVSRAMTPSKSTDWDNFESIKKELEQCKAKNTKYFTNVDALCTILKTFTLEESLSTVKHAAELTSPVITGSTNESNAVVSNPNNAHYELLMEMSEMLNAKDVLDEKKSLRENFVSIAYAASYQVESMSDKLAKLETELRSVRLSNESSESISKSAEILEDKLRKTEYRANKLETQMAETQEQLATEKQNIKLLTTTISNLHQQCFAAESALENARIERDGWHQKALEKDQALNHRTDENKKMREIISQQRDAISQNTNELASNNCSLGQNQKDERNWEQNCKELVEATREEEHERWQGSIHIIQKSNSTQIGIYQQVAKFWKDAMDMVLRSCTYYKAQQGSQFSGTEVGNLHLQAYDTKLLSVIEELEFETDQAIKTAKGLENKYKPKVARYPGIQDQYIGLFAKIEHDFNTRITCDWHESLRQCIVGLASAGSDRLHGTNEGRTDIREGSPVSSLGSSDIQPPIPLTEQQKASIRDHFEMKKNKLVAKHAERESALKDERDRYKSAYIETNMKCKELRETSVNAALESKKAAKEKYRCVRDESRYLRKKIQIFAESNAMVKYQKEVLVKLIGGYEGIQYRIDELMQKRREQYSPIDIADEHSRNCRQMWRRVLMAIRFYRRVQSIFIQSKQAANLKDKALSSQEPLPQLSGRSHIHTHSTTKHAHNIQKHIGFRSKASIAPITTTTTTNININNTAPVTPSRLRNRSSDLRSSISSSQQ